MDQIVDLNRCGDAQNNNNMTSLAKYQDLSPQIERQARQTLEQGLSGLQFEAQLESRFEHYFNLRYLHLNRVYALAGALINSFFCFADQLVLGPAADDVLVVRVLAAVFVIGLVLLSHIGWFVQRIQMLLCLGAYSIQLSLIGIAAHAAQAGIFHYQSGTIICVVFALAVLRLQFQFALPLALMLWFSQILGMHFFMALPTTQFIELLFIHTAVTIIAAMMGFRMEYETRMNFLRQAVLRADRRNLEDARDELRKLSLIDPLTAIANRRHFDNALQSEWNRAQRDQTPLALIMLDVDHFKKYNDLYGHDQGDTCLIAVATLLRNSMRRATDTLARYGGEEFAIILANTGPHTASGIAKQLVKDVAGLKILHKGAEEPVGIVTISAGVSAILPTAESAKEQLLQAADQALYQAKRCGRNCVCEALPAGNGIDTSSATA